MSNIAPYQAGLQRRYHHYLLRLCFQLQLMFLFQVYLQIGSFHLLVILPIVPELSREMITL